MEITIIRNCYSNIQLMVGRACSHSTPHGVHLLIIWVIEASLQTGLVLALCLHAHVVLALLTLELLPGEGLVVLDLAAEVILVVGMLLTVARCLLLLVTTVLLDHTTQLLALSFSLNLLLLVGTH